MNANTPRHHQNLHKPPQTTNQADEDLKDHCGCLRLCQRTDVQKTSVSFGEVIGPESASVMQVVFNKWICGPVTDLCGEQTPNNIFRSGKWQ